MHTDRTNHLHDVIRDVERKKERKKDTSGNGKMKKESCLRWDSNPRHSVFQTDALPTELTCNLLYMYMYTLYMHILYMYSILHIM